MPEFIVIVLQLCIWTHLHVLLQRRICSASRVALRIQHKVAPVADAGPGTSYCLVSSATSYLTYILPRCP
jgi:hypothetical protein